MKQALISLSIALYACVAQAQLYNPIGGDGNVEPINPGVYDYGEQPNYTGQFGTGSTYPEPQGRLGLGGPILMPDAPDNPRQHRHCLLPTAQQPCD